MHTGGGTKSDTFRASLVGHVDAGEWDEALDLAIEVAGDTGPLPAKVAWRAIMMVYLQGDLDVCESMLARSIPAEAASPEAASPGVDGAEAASPGVDGAEAAEEALLAAWSASVWWGQGDVQGCRTAATRAIDLAQPDGSPQALAAAHTALALVAAGEGDRRASDRHHALALAAAERAGDATQQLRIRTNRGSQRMEEGDLVSALSELEEALAIATEQGGAHPAFVGLAQTNRAEVLLRAGRLVDARDGFRAACLTLQRAGAQFVAHPLIGLGQSHELRGDLTQARVAYQEAVTVAEAITNAQALVPALNGLTRVLAAAGDGRAARQTASRSVSASTGMTEAAAWVATGWALLADGDAGGALAHAEQARASAGRHRNPATVAESLELAAMAHDAADSEPLLADAERVWADIGDRVGTARVALVRAWRAGPSGVSDAVLAEHRLRVMHIDPTVGTRSLSRQFQIPGRPVTVRVLGSFAVCRSDGPVPATGWQSRKARDLLKLLVARRGRPLTRETIGETLWPGEESVANRLSISLSVLRAVLDPDRTVSSDRYVVADAAGIGYRVETLAVDVDVFLILASAALVAARSGPIEDALVLLDAAESAYTGDVLEDEPDLTAMETLRDEARAAYLAVTRALGQFRAEAGDVDGAIQVWLRLLEREPYDEDCALRLVDLLIDNGRHGEAARHYRRYAERMESLEVSPAPRPVVVHAIHR